MTKEIFELSASMILQALLAKHQGLLIHKEIAAKSVNLALELEKQINKLNKKKTKKSVLQSTDLSFLGKTK